MRVLITDTNWNTMMLAYELERLGFLVSRADDAEALLQFVALGQQDAVLIDQDLPDMSLTATMHAVRGLKPMLPLFVMGDRACPLKLSEMMRAGADDLFTPPFDLERIGGRIRALVCRSAGSAGPVLHLGALSVDLFSQEVWQRDQILPLTRYEYEIVEHLALRADSYVDREALMDQLYGWEDEPSDRVIDVYFSRIRSKIRKAGGDAGIIQTAWSRGHMICEAGAPFDETGIPLTQVA